MGDTLHIRINNPFAFAIIENLAKMHALDLLANDDDEIEITETIKEETTKRLELLKQNPQSAVSLGQFKSHLQSRLAK